MLPIPKVEESAEAQTKNSKKVKEPKAPAVVNKEDGMVLYADAGARPNPGFGGWGVHGYTYSLNPPKKGSGNPSFKLTQNGYVSKSDVVEEVTPLSYVDAYGTIPSSVSNNLGEVRAASEGMLYASRFPISELTLYTDSTYVVKGTSEHLPRWSRNGWVKADGNVISNKADWQDLHKNLTTLQNAGVNVNFKWVRGHNGDQGNELADKYATVGVFTSKTGQLKQQIETTKADGYWTSAEEKHPMLTHRRCYFTTNREYNEPGEYYLGEHGKDDDQVGKRMADGAYAYLKLTNPDPYLEILRSKQLAIANREDAMILARLDKLFELQTRIDLMRFGDVVLQQNSYDKLDLYYINDIDEKKKEPITKELNPIRIAIRAIEAVNCLKGIYLKLTEDAVNEEKNDLILTDITSEIYDIDLTNTKNQYTLKDRFVSGFTDLPVKVSHTDAGELIDVSLTLGLDLPDRNTFKRLEKHKPVIKVVMWSESPDCVRHATYIVTDNASGVWAGYYTNTKYLSTKK